jgi:hypothetical protein
MSVSAAGESWLPIKAAEISVLSNRYGLQPVRKWLQTGPALDGMRRLVSGIRVSCPQRTRGARRRPADEEA